MKDFEDFITYEQAKLLKEKGFHELCHYATHANENLIDYHHKAKDFNGDEYIGLESEWFSRPTLSVVHKWLIEEKNIYLDIISIIEDNWDVIYGYIIKKRDLKDPASGCTTYNTYKQALSAGINEALELIK